MSGSKLLILDTRIMSCVMRIAQHDIPYRRYDIWTTDNEHKRVRGNCRQECSFETKRTGDKSDRFWYGKSQKEFFRCKKNVVFLESITILKQPS